MKKTIVLTCGAAIVLLCVGYTTLGVYSQIKEHYRQIQSQRTLSNLNGAYTTITLSALPTSTPTLDIYTNMQNNSCTGHNFVMSYNYSYDEVELSTGDVINNQLTPCATIRARKH